MSDDRDKRPRSWSLPGLNIDFLRRTPSGPSESHSASSPPAALMPTSPLPPSQPSLSPRICEHGSDDSPLCSPGASLVQQKLCEPAGGSDCGAIPISNSTSNNRTSDNTVHYSSLASAASVPLSSSMPPIMLTRHIQHQHLHPVGSPDGFVRPKPKGVNTDFPDFLTFLNSPF